MIILSIDPGFERVGIAVIKKEKSSKETLIHSECFKTSKDETFADRLVLIATKIEAICEEHKPTLLSTESLFMATNLKTGIQVAHARGVIIATARKHGLEVHEYTPLQVKVAVTGYGKSDKTAVMKMVPKIIHMAEIKHSDDELDAIAIGLTAIAHLHLQKINGGLSPY
jgi:crossover junction endodeoxyribonuclease RuvC